MALVRSPAQQEATSSCRSGCSYDVFLSFRGEDTRKTFTDHLYTASVNAGFRTFRDDDELPRGQNIKPELEKAIKESRSSVIVFSKDYAKSGWCLDELVMIMERKRTADHIVLPVFYHVDPSHVRKQTGTLAKEFARHERNHSLKDKVKRWRAALTQVADLAGMVLQNEADGHESKFIGKIVSVMEDKLRRIPLSLEPYLIGIDSRAKDINLWLQDGSTDVGILLIHGMRGIGKSTIAKFVYNSNFQRFERCSFLENIREVSQQSNGLLRLQKQLLHDLLNGKKVKIHGISEGIAKIEDAVSSKRVLLVLDDVDHVDQKDALIRMKDRFYPGSKIIITTSSPGFEAHHQFDKVHNVETLKNSESLALFSFHAFGQDYPIESYVDHSKRVVDHCGGLPLALKVLGSSLSGKNISVWESALNKLEAIPNGEILKKLKISYDSLQDEHDKSLFLHIACFFIGMNKDLFVKILDACDFFTKVGIQNLIDRCLITIEYNMVRMHDMIRNMGREIVRLESKEPGERSRLWHHKDSFQVLTKNTGTQTIEGLVLNMQMHPAYTASRNSNNVVLETNAFTRMHKLRFLQLSHVQLNGCYKEFPTGLRWFSWIKCPLYSLPIDFPLESLIALDMSYSSLKQVWRGTKYVPSLKILNLSHSHDLRETPDFSFVPNLERLDLRDCVSLIDFHESIINLKRLVYLNLRDCISLRKLPKNISMLCLLETLILSGCSSLNEFPVDLSKIESLKVFEADEVPIHRLLTTMEVELRMPLEISLFSYLPRNLVALKLSNCNLSDDDFPRDFGSLSSSLQFLDLDKNPISSLPQCIRGVTGLQILLLRNCTRLKSLVKLPTVSELLMVSGCTSIEKLSFQSKSNRPRHFTCDSCTKLVEIEGNYKLEPIERVDKEIINLLSLSNMEFPDTIMMDSTKMSTMMKLAPAWKGTHPIQGLYEYGIFSTFLSGNDVPGFFSHRRRGSSMSFTVPVLNNLNIRGLNVFSVLAKSNNNDSNPPMINILTDEDHPSITVVSNKSKGLRWIYAPSFFGIPGDEKNVIWLSHWNFRNGHLEGGDEVTVLVYTKSEFKVKECGIQLVYYEEQENKIISTQLDTMDDPWYLKQKVASSPRLEVMPGAYLLYNHKYDIDYLRRYSVLFNNLLKGTDEIKEEGQQGEEGQEGELILTDAEHNNNNYGCRGRKGIMIIIAFLSVFSLVSALISSLFQREKQQATMLIPT